MKQIINYLLTIILWIAGIMLVFFKFPYLLYFLLIMHFVELIMVGWKTGKDSQLSTPGILIMCMLFGNYWWRPIRQRIKEEELSEKDFMEV